MSDFLRNPQVWSYIQIVIFFVAYLNGIPVDAQILILLQACVKLLRLLGTFTVSYFSGILVCVESGHKSWSSGNFRFVTNLQSVSKLWQKFRSSCKSVLNCLDSWASSFLDNSQSWSRESANFFAQKSVSWGYHSTLRTANLCIVWPTTTLLEKLFM